MQTLFNVRTSRAALHVFFRRLAPSAGDPPMRWLCRTTEGPDDMPAHIKAALRGCIDDPQVAPASDRHGISRALMAELAGEREHRSRKSVHAEVGDRNVAALKRYDQFGLGRHPGRNGGGRAAGVSPALSPPQR